MSAIKPLSTEAILLEAEDFCFLNKPSGVATVPAGNIRRSETFLELAENLIDAPLWVVHRLDRETSGVILFAKNAEFHRTASMLFEAREVKKQYWFIACGEPKLPLFRADEPIEGKRSRTQFRVLGRGTGYFVGEALPLTGRRHQIRIHLSKAGYPILGDHQYGGKGKNPLNAELLSHFFLHARSLEIPGVPKVEAPVPADWSALWEGARGDSVSSEKVKQDKEDEDQ